jgi:hypothetical protein
LLKKKDARAISQFLQLILSAVEMTQLHAERGEVELSKNYVGSCKEQIRKMTDFIQGNTLE